MKTIFKLTAIAAVAATLSACGGGGGGGSSIASTPAAPNFQTSTPVVVSSDPKIAGLSDVVQAHRAGWTGQNTAILTTGGTGSYGTSIFETTKLIAPSALVSHSLTFDSGAEGGIIATNANLAALSGFTTGSRVINGIAVMGDLVEGGSARVTVNPDGTTYRVDRIDGNIQKQFTSVANCSDCSAQTFRSAYLLGSAAIIQSKFASLTPTNVVQVMDQNRDGTGAFSLANSLAARSIR